MSKKGIVLIIIILLIVSVTLINSKLFKEENSEVKFAKSDFFLGASSCN